LAKGRGMRDYPRSLSYSSSLCCLFSQFAGAANVYPLTGAQTIAICGSTGAPFLSQGDAAWSLISVLQRKAESTSKIAAPRDHSVIVNLIEHQFRRAGRSLWTKPFRPWRLLNPRKISPTRIGSSAKRPKRHPGFLAPVYLGYIRTNEGLGQRYCTPVLKGRVGDFHGRQALIRASTTSSG